MTEKPEIPARAPLEASGLRVRIGGRPVLRGLDLALESGSLSLVLGGNGEGKTTLLKTLAGLIRPLGGHVAWFGQKDLASRPELRARIGYLGHDPLLYEDLSAYGNLLFFSRLYGLSSPHRRVNSALEAAGLWMRRDDPPRRFSRGMRGRLALARTTLHRPALLLLDEPDSGLDDSGRNWLRGLLESHVRDGGAAVVTTHDERPYGSLGPRVLRLQAGTLASAGASPAGSAA